MGRSVAAPWATMDGHSTAIPAGTGTLSTTHSHSAESTMDCLASRVAQGGVLSVEEAYR